MYFVCLKYGASLILPNSRLMVADVGPKLSVTVIVKVAVYVSRNS